MNNKGFMTPADIFATIGVIVILALYLVVMSFFGISETKSNELIESEFSAINSMTLYSYLESPVGSERMVDVLRYYADSDFSNKNLETIINSESEKIFNKLNFCAEDKAYFNIVIIDGNNGNKLEIFNPKWSKGLYEMGMQFNELALVQRIPYEDGIFYVKYYGSYLEGTEKGCGEVLTYE
jgi:hypothetical protein